MRVLSVVLRQKRFLTALGAVVAMLAALLIPTSAASAAVSTSQTTKTTNSTNTSKPSTTPSTKADKPVDTAAPVPKPQTRPTPPIAAAKPSSSAGALSKARAAAAKNATARSTVPNTCSGAISPDVVYPCTTPSSTGTDTFTVNQADATDLLVVQVLSTGGSELPFTLTAPGGTTVSCVSTMYGQIPQCATSASGTYAVAVSNEATNYTIAYMPLLSDTSCGAINPSFAAPPVNASIAADAVGTCYTLNVPSGHSIQGNLAANSDSYIETLLTIYDSTGAQICFAQSSTCALTGTGPYRVLVDNGQGTAFSYAFELNDITAPAGCVTAKQLSYGTAPDDSSSDQCRQLTVTTADEYQVYGATTWSGGGVSGSLYTAAGAAACTNFGPFCQLSPGTYYFIALEDPLAPYDFAVVFIAADESHGCKATGDTDFASGPATGKFSGIGEAVCLNLPTAAGTSVYVFDERFVATNFATPLLIVDATGAQQCTNLYNSSGTCTPTGTAPFRLLAESQQSTNTGYKVLVQATDSTDGCKAWPQSGFGGSWGATATTSPVSNFVCLSLPAAQHSIGEMIDYADTTNTEDGGIAVNDPTGTQVCLVLTTSTCSYKPGVTYTAILSNSGQNQTYHLVRRDVTQSATCSAPASTTVGGPSDSFVLNSALDTTCYRVTGAATDDMRFDVRTLAPYPARAVLFVTNASGIELCPLFSSLCQVTGSTDYQVIADASGYAGYSIAAHLDTWRVATAAGPAPECQAHPFSVNGWAPVSGTLTESATAFCAAIPIQPSEDFSIFGTNPAPEVSVNALTSWGTRYAMCSGFGDCYTGNSTGEAILVVSLYGTETPADFSIQGVCVLGCTGRPGPATITSISPASQPAGPSNEVTVTGTNLNLGTKVMLATDGNPVSTSWISRPVSVNSTGTSVTVDLDTSGITPGLYDVVLNADFSVPPTPPGYLVGAYTVTAAPPNPPNSGFATVTPSRILDTQTGVGAPKARVAAGGTLSLGVSGVGGVPTSGVTAVAVDLTAVNPSASGYITAYADGAARPGTSDVNFSAGKSLTNLAVVPVANGKIDLYNGSGGTVDLTADIDGYYTDTSGGSVLTTLTSAQILNSVTGAPGGPAARIPAGGTTSVNVLGAGGVPTSGVTAVLLNVNTVKPQAAGSLTVYDGSVRPAVTDASFAAGQSVSNLVVVPVSDGTVDFYNGSTSSIDLAAAVVGYYSTTGSGFQAFGPERILDTRTGLGGSGETVVPGGVAILSNLGGMPNTATAMVLNVTVVGAQHSGTLSLLNPDLTTPPVANITFRPGQAISDTVIVPFIGGMEFYNNSEGTVQVVADIEGYYTN